jgi:hypothetical protein
VVAILVNVLLLRTTQENEERVGRLRPVIVGPSPSAPTPAIDPTAEPVTPAATETNDQGGDDQGGAGNEDDDRSGHRDGEDDDD